METTASPPGGRADRVVLTVEEAAAMLRIGRSAAYEGVRSGAIPSVRIGRLLRVPRHALDAMLGIPEYHEAPRVTTGERAS